jgi:hypothetical protein
MDTYFLSYDDSIQREKMLYLNMLYDMIAYSINKGFKEIIFARTALEKKFCWCKPIQMYGYIGHTNPVVNVLCQKYFVILSLKRHGKSAIHLPLFVFEIATFNCWANLNI